MKLAIYLTPAGATRVAGVRDGMYIDLRMADPGLPPTLREILELGPQGLVRVAAAKNAGPQIDPRSVTTLAPIPNPQKVFGVGLNFADHAREQGKEPPPEPVIFAKLPTAIIGPEQPIVLPRCSAEVDLEAELVAVIGRRGKNIPREQAHQYIAGYMVGNDVSARDWQQRKPGGQWVLGKSFDTFAPCGPYFVTADEVGELSDLRITSRIDGRTMQDSTLAQLIFDVPTLIAYLSQVCTLSPGDLIFTGTPPGVGMARKPPVWLQAGQTVEIEIDRLGTLRNPVVAE